MHHVARKSEAHNGRDKLSVHFHCMQRLTVQCLETHHKVLKPSADLQPLALALFQSGTHCHQ